MNVSQTLKLLQLFESKAAQQPGPIPYSLSIPSKGTDFHIHISSIIHGDEVGSLPAILQIIDELNEDKIDFSGKITFTLGNIQAAKINQRFVQNDLNRMFLNLDSSDSYEQVRAKEIASVIDQADVLLDLHQTMGPTKNPFYVCMSTKKNQQLIKALGITPFAITSDVNVPLAKGKLSALEYAQSKGIPGILLELSQLGYNPQAQSDSYLVITNLIKASQEWDLDQNKLLNLKDKPLHELRITHGHSFHDSKMKLNPGLINLQHIKKGTQLGQNGDGSTFNMPQDGYVIFPKYPDRNDNGEAIKPIPSDLFWVAQEHSCTT